MTSARHGCCGVCWRRCGRYSLPPPNARHGIRRTNATGALISLAASLRISVAFNRDQLIRLPCPHPDGFDNGDGVGVTALARKPNETNGTGPWRHHPGLGIPSWRVCAFVRESVGLITGISKTCAPWISQRRARLDVPSVDFGSTIAAWRLLFQPDVLAKPLCEGFRHVRRWRRRRRRLYGHGRWRGRYWWRNQCRSRTKSRSLRRS